MSLKDATVSPLKRLLSKAKRPQTEGKSKHVVVLEPPDMLSFKAVGMKQENVVRKAKATLQIRNVCKDSTVIFKIKTSACNNLLNAHPCLGDIAPDTTMTIDLTARFAKEKELESAKIMVVSAKMTQEEATSQSPKAIWSAIKSNAIMEHRLKCAVEPAASTFASSTMHDAVNMMPPFTPPPKKSPSVVSSSGSCGQGTHYTDIQDDVQGGKVAKEGFASDRGSDDVIFGIQMNDNDVIMQRRDDDVINGMQSGLSDVQKMSEFHDIQGPSRIDNIQRKDFDMGFPRTDFDLANQRTDVGLGIHRNQGQMVNQMSDGISNMQMTDNVDMGIQRMDLVNGIHTQNDAVGNIQMTDANLAIQGPNFVINNDDSTSEKNNYAAKCFLILAIIISFTQVFLK